MKYICLYFILFFLPNCLCKANTFEVKELKAANVVNKSKIEKFLVVVECAIEYQGKLLIIKRPQGVHGGGFLSFPGGKVEYNDGVDSVDILKEAAKREILEELGLTLVDPLIFITSSYFVNPDQDHVLDVILFCKVKNSNLDIIPSAREIAEYNWLTPDEILAHKDCPIWLKRYIFAIVNTEL